MNNITWMKMVPDKVWYLGFLDKRDIITQPRKIVLSTWYLLIMKVNPKHAF